MNKTETCLVCALGKARVVSRQVSFVLLQKTGHFTVHEYRCDHCGESYVHDDQARANEASERLASRKVLRRIGAAELKCVREIARATQPEMEIALGLGRNVIARWETGQRSIPPYIQTIVRLVALNPGAIRTLHEGLEMPETNVEHVILNTFRSSTETVVSLSGGVFQNRVPIEYQAPSFLPANDHGEAA